MKAAGRIRYVGITHYNAGAYDELAAVMRAERFDFLQINYSLDEREAERQILPLAAERGMAVLINRPFGGGGCCAGCVTAPCQAGRRRSAPPPGRNCCSSSSSATRQ